MSRRPPAESRTRRDEGFALTELLVAIVVGVVIIFAIVQLLDTSISMSRRTQSRVDSAQRGRLAMDLVTRELRSQTCLSAAEPALVAAANTDVTYFISLGAPDAVPEKHQLLLSGGDLVLKRWVGVRAAAGVIPSVTYPVGASSTQVLAENVQQVGTTPLFRYYSWTAGTNPLPSTLMTTPITGANLALPVKVAITFTVLPERNFNRSTPTSTFEDSVFTRLADPNDTSHGQACN
jgi:hypothetical protein